MQLLEFEKPIAELERELDKLRTKSDSQNIDMSAEIAIMEGKLADTRRSIYENLTPWQRVQIARHTNRPFMLDYVSLAFTGFSELHGDRHYHDDPAIVFDGVSTNLEGAVAVGTRWALDDASTAEMGVFRTGRRVRVDRRDWQSLDGPAAEAGHRLGIVSTVASPIVVDGRPWGAISVSSAEEPLPPDTEGRLEKFTELLATAIANAESSDALARLDAGGRVLGSAARCRGADRAGAAR